MNLSLFNRDWYLAQNPDIAAAAAAGLIDPEQHFIQFGMAEGRSPHPLFDAEFYVQANPDVAAAVASGSLSAAEHFFLFGMNEPRAINPVIHLGEYLASNPDVAQAAQNGQIDALSHLLNHGVREGRELGNGISARLFTQDPVFANALEQGNAGAALQRVAEVAPFLPTFRAPEGWTPPATTPIPVDFTPPAGVQLVVPASVRVPENVTLPPQFSAPVVNPPGPPAQPTPPGNSGSPGNSGGSGNSGSPSDDNGGNTDTPDVQTPPAATQLFTPKTGTTAGSSDASTAIALDANYMVVGDDEANVLRVYDRKGGEALVEWSFESTTKGAFGNDELDLEAGTRIGDTLYFIGSHSNKKSGAEADSREFLFSVNVKGTGAGTTFEVGNVRDGLETLLVNWDSSNAHGKDANYFGFAVSAGSGVIPEAVNGFSIEGMTVSLNGNELLLGFRAPQTDASTRDKAVIVPLKLDGLFGATPTIGTPIELDLGGRGIRAIEKAADNSGYLILAGPAMSASPDVTHDFRLFTWNGSAAPQELDVNLDTLRDVTGGSFETLVEVPSLVPGTRIQLLQDNGDTVWEGQAKVSKDLSPADQKFLGNWITLGSAATNQAPELKAGNIVGESAIAIGGTSNLVFQFSEAVKWGDGSIVLKTAGDSGTTIETFSVSSGNSKFVYNTLTLDPVADLAAGNYVLEFSNNAIQDLAGLPAVSLSSHGFTVEKPAPKTVIITEVNSKASGGDFFEIYNHGDAPVNLAGWRYADSDQNKFGVFGDFTLAAGEILVVGVGDTTTAGLRSAWNLGTGVNVITVGGNNLGSQDAVLVYDAADNLVTAFNYTETSINASLDNTSVASVTSTTGLHAGAAVGGAEAESAVWDGQSVVNPNYVNASTYKAINGLGTPGVVLPKLHDILITEVNSNYAGTDAGAKGKDFFELYNHGTAAIDLSGWKWLDSSQTLTDSGLKTFADNTTLTPGSVLVVGVDDSTVDGLRAAWGLSDTVNVVAIGGKGLGSNDGVFLYDANDNLVAAFNYKAVAYNTPIKNGSMMIAPIHSSQGGHVGAAVGAEAATSAIWDGQSVYSPVYIAATGAQPPGTPGFVNFE